MDRIPTDRQKKCKCGLDVGNLMNDIRVMGEHLTKLKMTESSTYIPAFRISINDIYSNIRNIEESCSVDARPEQSDSISASNKIDEMEAIKDTLKFDVARMEVINDLSRIRYGIMEKIRDCSK